MLCLPENYTYLFTQNTEGDRIFFRIKEVDDESKARAWIKEFSECSCTTWRVERTFPASGRINIFKIDLRCQHLTDKRVHNVRASKNTDCPAKLQVIVKRFVEKSRKRIYDPLLKDWPTVVALRSSHNHSLQSAESLKHRPMSESTREKLISLFKTGHGPSSALQTLKTELELVHGEKYSEISCDGYYMPTLSVVEKLFKKQLPLETNKILPCEVAPQTELDNCSQLIVENNNKKDEQPSPKLSLEEESEVESLLSRIKEGMTANPQSYVPAVQKMLKCIREHVREKGLLNTLHIFGNCADLKPVSKSSRAFPNVQQTSFDCSSRKRALSEVPETHTVLTDHDYTKPCPHIK